MKKSIDATLRAAAVFVLLAWAVGCATAPSNASKSSVNSSRDARDLRVMSFNLRCPTIFDGINYWPLRKENLVRTIESFAPDVLGTQECVAAQADYLSEQLADYQFVGAGRNDGKRSGEMCGIFFNRDRLELIESGNFWLSNRPEKPGSRSWGSVFTRMVTWAKLRSRSTGQIFCHFNTHFDVFSERARIESANLLRQRMQAIAGAMPIVITGDFNDNPGSECYRIMTGSLLVDAFRAANPQPTRDEGTMHSFGGGTRGPRIDWIFTSGAVQTIAANIDRNHDGGRFPSDHFPVEAVLRFAPRTTVSRID